MRKLAGVLLIILAALALAVPIGAQTDEPTATEEPQPPCHRKTRLTYASRTSPLTPVLSIS